MQRLQIQLEARLWEPKHLFIAYSPSLSFFHYPHTYYTVRKAVNALNHPSYIHLSITRHPGFLTLHLQQRAKIIYKHSTFLLHIHVALYVHMAMRKRLYVPCQANLVLIAYASREGSGEPAHPRSLARTSPARSYKQWVKRNHQTESQIPGPSEWLGMPS